MSYLDLVKLQIARLGVAFTLLFIGIFIPHGWDSSKLNLDWYYWSGFCCIYVFGGALVYWWFPKLRYRDYFKRF